MNYIFLNFQEIENVSAACTWNYPQQVVTKTVHGKKFFLDG